MDGSFRTTRRRRQSSTRRSSRRHFRDGQCAAALRAITGARLYLGKQVPSLAEAAVSVGSNIPYIAAAITLIKAEDATLRERVLEGHVTLFAAATQVQQVADLVSAYRAATTDDLVALGRTVGAERLFTDVIERVL